MSIIFNGVGLFLTGSEIILAKLSENEGKYYVSILNSNKPGEQITNATNEIVLISYLEDFFDSFKTEEEIFDIRVTLSQKFFYSFSFLLEKTHTTKDIKEQISWEFSILFPGKKFENFVSSFFITEVNGKKSVNVLLLNKKIPNALFKFASRRKFNIRFIEHPAIASFNASKLIEKDFEFFVYSDDEHITFSTITNAKISRFITAEKNSENFVERFLSLFELTENQSAKVVLTGFENEAIEEILKSKSNIEILIPDFAKFIEQDSLNKIDTSLFPPIIGLLTRVR